MPTLSRRRFLQLTCVGLPVWLMTSKDSVLGAAVEALSLPTPGPLGDFSFVHVSDTHVSPFYDMPEDLGRLRSYDAVRTLRALGPVRPAPDAAPTLSPEFAIHTGDITEYGFPGVTQQLVDRYVDGMPFPFYWCLGNHDNTWVTDTRRFRELYGDVSYTFDHKGVRFIGLNSATFQEPLPSFGEETILFLREVLRQTPPTTPLVLFWHHPFNPASFASEYDKDRVRDELRDHHLAVVLLGHFHRATRNDIAPGLDGCIATATFSDAQRERDGYSVVDIQGGVLRVINVHAFDHSRTNLLLEKRLDTAPARPKATIAAPAFREVLSGDTVPVRASCDGGDGLREERLLNGEEITDQTDLSAAPNGAHYLKVRFHRGDQPVAERSTAFDLDRPHPASPRTRWSRPLGAAAIPTPLHHQGAVYIGTNLGTLHCLDAETGEERWRRRLGAEILRAPAIHGDTILVGAGDGRIHVLGLDGTARSTIDAGHAVYCPLVVEDGRLYYGTTAPQLVCHDLAQDTVVWRNGDARYCVESRPVLTADRVYFTAWDGYFHCIDKASGSQIWRVPGPKNREREEEGGSSTRYYGPADTPPIVLEDRIVLSDRGYLAAIYDLDGTHRKTFATNVAALAHDPDHARLIARHIDEPAAAYTLDGEKVWTASVAPGRLPVVPTITGRLVLMTTNDGHLHAIDRATGATRWTYRVTPQLFVLGRVAVDEAGRTAFAAGMDGVLRAIDLDSVTG